MFNQITPAPGNILVKKLDDITTTQSGIVLPTNAPVNKNYVVVEVVKVGKDLSEDMNIKIEVKPGDRCIAFGRGIYDAISINDEEHYIVKQADIPLIIERGLI